MVFLEEVRPQVALNPTTGVLNKDMRADRRDHHVMTEQRPEWCCRKPRAAEGGQPLLQGRGEAWERTAPPASP